VTSVQDLDGSAPETRRKLFRTYQRLAREGRSPAASTCGGRSRNTRSWRTPARADFGNDYVRVGGVKGYMDGSLGSSTAKMFDPYEGDPKNTGVYVTSRTRCAASCAAPTRRA
jgi:predicted amidohydrolase YtcJ